VVSAGRGRGESQPTRQGFLNSQRKGGELALPLVSPKDSSSEEKKAMYCTVLIGDYSVCNVTKTPCEGDWKERYL